MSAERAETVIVGSGIAGTLVARELSRAGRSCTIVERGAFVPWAEQARTLTHQRDVATAVHNHELDPGGEPWNPEYLYMVGGSCNHWTGTTPRLLPEDFEMRSRYGVSLDWPIGYDELEPFYASAERALAVAGAPNALMPGFDPPQPAHPFSPQDQAIRSLLPPYIALPQARPSRPVRGNPACCGSARCYLCPVNARYSVLNGLGDVLRDRRVRLIDETAAVRLVKSAGGRDLAAVECVDGAGKRSTIEAERVVVAANAIESCGLLLRSQIDDGPTGRYFAARALTTMRVVTGTPVGPGEGASHSTGASYAFYGGPARSRRAAAVLIPLNMGDYVEMAPNLVEQLADERSGTKVRSGVVDRWRRSFNFSLGLDELPNPRGTVRLASAKDGLGLPRNRVRIAGPSDYQRRAVAALAEQLPRRLRSLKVRSVTVEREQKALHLEGGLRMGAAADSSVVDPGLRHHRLDNLFVVGASVFPTAPPVPPTLTIAALALRLGKRLAQERR